MDVPQDLECMILTDVESSLFMDVTNVNIHDTCEGTNWIMIQKDKNLTH